MYNNLTYYMYGHVWVTDRSHTHPSRSFWRIYWNPTPGGIVVCDGTKYHLDSSKVIAIPPNLSVSQEMYQPFANLCFHVDTDGFLGFYSDIVFFSAGRELVKSLEELAARIELGQITHSPPGPMLEIACNAFVYHVFTHIDQSKVRYRALDGRIAKAQELLAGAIRAGIRNPVLAASVSLSTNAFIRLFKQETGVSPQEYLQSLRIKESCTLLTCSTLSIEEISEACGFCERSYFSRVFKQIHQLGPAEYRKRTKDT